MHVLKKAIKSILKHLVVSIYVLPIYFISVKILYKQGLRGNRLFALFVDFKRAFDSVNHNLLWDSLYNLGVSTKIIRIIKNIYQNASGRVKGKDGFSSEMDITTGLLQGEVLSPYLFTLYISDIERFFRNKNAGGIIVNSTCDILLLLYADDLIILADSYTYAKMKLNILNEYCMGKQLEVNTQKTKVVCFHKGGCKKIGKLFYGDKEIEIVPEYIYLGVPFSNSGLFHRASKYFDSKTRAAFGSVITICAKSKLRSWESKIKIKNAIAMSVLYYNVQLWGLRYTDYLERVNLNFFKRLFSLNKNTPFYLARLEFNIPHCSVAILKLALNWVLKLLKMSSHRLPKICFNELRKIHIKGKSELKYNWVSQLSSLLSLINKQSILELEDAGQSLLEMTEMVSLFKSYTEERDKQKLVSPIRYSPLYPLMYIDSDLVQPYLALNAPFPMIKTLAQLRLSGNYIIKLTFNNIYYYFKPKENCTICNLNELEDVFHILVRCPIYSAFRQHYLPHSLDMNRSNYVELLKIENIHSLKNIFYYIRQCCKLKSFIVNE